VRSRETGRGREGWWWYNVRCAADRWRRTRRGATAAAAAAAAEREVLTPSTARRVEAAVCEGNCRTHKGSRRSTKSFLLLLCLR
jgi:hypothetical protein